MGKSKLSKKAGIFTIFILTLVWIILRENFSLFTIISGIIFGAVVLLFCNKYLPLGKITDVNFAKLALYPLYLIGQVYLAGLYVVKLIFLGADVEVIKLKTKIENESLRYILVDSITLTPGSILLDLEQNEITLLWLKDKRVDLSINVRDESIKGKMERWLMKAELKRKE